VRAHPNMSLLLVLKVCCPCTENVAVSVPKSKRSLAASTCGRRLPPPPAGTAILTCLQVTTLCKYAAERRADCPRQGCPAAECRSRSRERRPAFSASPPWSQGLLMPQRRGDCVAAALPLQWRIVRARLMTRKFIHCD